MGPLETAIRETVAELAATTGVTRSLAELAYILAERLDRREGGNTGMAIAGNAKELRETLKQMTEVSGASTALDDLLSELKVPVLSEVRDSKIS